MLRNPDVIDAAVVAIPSEDWGETPMAFVVLRPGAATDGAAVLEAANRNLGKAQRIRHIEILDELPRSPIGKILKRELRAPYWADR